MIANLKQPARAWLADHLKNFAVLLDEGADPSCKITLHGVEIEVRLNYFPGVYERRTIELETGDAGR